MAYNGWLDRGEPMRSMGLLWFGWC